MQIEKHKDSQSFKYGGEIVSNDFPPSSNKETNKIAKEIVLENRDATSTSEGEKTRN